MLTRQQIDRVIGSRKVVDGVAEYCWLQSRLGRPGPVTRDLEFQARFSRFYGLNRPAASLRRLVFRELVSATRRRSVSYPGVLTRLHRLHGSVEASFASKILASVDPSQPVIDKWVLRNTGLKLPHFGSRDRVTKTVRVHRELKRRCGRFLRTGVGRYLVRRFRRLHKAYNVTEMKMLDFILWQTR